MIAIARGSITEPDKLGPFIDDEMRIVEQLKAEGVMKALYRRAAAVDLTAAAGEVCGSEGAPLQGFPHLRGFIIGAPGFEPARITDENRRSDRKPLQTLPVCSGVIVLAESRILRAIATD